MLRCLFSNCDLLKFAKSRQLLGNLCPKFSRMCGEIFTLLLSSAEIERMFCSLGYIHDETRDQLSFEKAEKRTFCFRLLH